MAENAQTISIDPNQGQQGPSQEEIDLQKKVWIADHRMRKADIIARVLSIGMYKDADGVLFSEEQRSTLEGKLFDLVDSLGND